MLLLQEEKMLEGLQGEKTLQDAGIIEKKRNRKAQKDRILR